MEQIQITNMTASRLPWIDWVKVLGIYLVILGHSLGVLGYNYIYAFHMPLFFMISGYLYKRVPIKAEWSKSVKTLILPYLYFNAILVIYSIVIGVFNDTIIPNILLGNQIGIIIDGQRSFFAPLWFIVSLFVIRIVASICESDKQLFCIAFATMLIGIICNRLGFFSQDHDYFQFCTSLIVFPFFAFGYYLKQTDALPIMKRVLGKAYLAFPLLCLLILLCLVSVNGRMNSFKCLLGKYGSLYYLVGGGISLIIIYLSRIFLNIECKLIMKLSTGMIVILSLNQAINNITNELVPNSAINAILLSFGTLLICTPVVLVILKYIPWLIGRS